MARVEAVVSAADADTVTYALSGGSSSLYVDPVLGFVYATAGEESLAGLCGDGGCSVEVEATSEDGSTASIDLTVKPASENQVCLLALEKLLQK